MNGKRTGQGSDLRPSEAIKIKPTATEQQTDTAEEERERQRETAREREGVDYFSQIWLDNRSKLITAHARMDKFYISEIKQPLKQLKNFCLKFEIFLIFT